MPITCQNQNSYLGSFIFLTLLKFVISWDLWISFFPFQNISGLAYHHLIGCLQGLSYVLIRFSICKLLKIAIEDNTFIFYTKGPWSTRDAEERGRYAFCCKRKTIKGIINTVNKWDVCLLFIVSPEVCISQTCWFSLLFLNWLLWSTSIRRNNNIVNFLIFVIWKKSTGRCEIYNVYIHCCMLISRYLLIIL